MPHLLQYPLCQRGVVVIAPEGRVAARGDHLEHPLRQAQDGNIKRTPTQVIHGVDALAGVVQAVGNCCRRGLVDEAQQVDARELGRILGSLALGVVKVRGHGDHRAVEIVIEGVFGPVAQRGEDLGADLDG